MARVEDLHKTPSFPNPTPNIHIFSQTSSSHPKDDHSPPPKPKPVSPKDAIIAIAARVAGQLLPCSDPDVWGVLTAISDKSRRRHQGINILLTADEHCIGRLVEDVRFQIDSTAISQRHCLISKKRVAKEDVETPSAFCDCAFLKDTSTNGTYLNWERLKRGSSKSEAKLCHGDIVSFAAPPQHEQAFTFVFREVLPSVSPSDATILKRKAEDCGVENKRFKGIGIGAPDGPVSLDDFRSLQRSNVELRKQLENHVLTIDKLQNENRGIVESHENEMKELKEAMSKSYLDQLTEFNESWEITKKELTVVTRSSVEQKHTIEDLNERLAAALQSCTEANEIIKSQKAAVAELKSQLDEERDQRKEEREKAAADLKASIQRVQSEAQEELKRVADDALRREREQKEVIYKLQESERASSSLVESLRFKSEETREKLVLSDNKVRQLEAQVSEEQHASAIRKERVEELEIEMRKMKRELDKEKAAREEAWAKVSALELDINAAMRDLEFERRRLKDAREKIMLRETQLRAFYTTTEEIKALFTKQQEQLKAMQRTLEDEEYFGNESFDVELDAAAGNIHIDVATNMETTGYRSNGVAKAGPGISAQRFNRDGVETSCDEGGATEKHDCDIRNQDDENTQEAEFPVEDGLVKGAFGSGIDGVDTAPILEGDADGTERFLETESPGINSERIDINKSGPSGNVAGDTMQLEDDTNVQETEQQDTPRCEDNVDRFNSSNREEEEKVAHDTEPEGIRTLDLLASEVAGSWACDTAPSVYGDNESPHNEREVDADAARRDSIAPVAESQNSVLATKMHPDVERQALSNMIGIMAPDVKEKFGSVGNGSQERNTKVPKYDSDTDDECIEASKNMDADSVSGSDDETQADDQADKIEENEDEMEEDDDDTQEDSVG